MNTTDKSLKEKATDFLKLVIEGQVRKAYELYVSKDFIHHNAYFKGDSQSLLAAMEESSIKDPNKIFEIQRIFRFNGNSIVELWDLGMEVPEEIVNENGLF